MVAMKARQPEFHFQNQPSWKERTSCTKVVLELAHVSHGCPHPTVHTCMYVQENAHTIILNIEKDRWLEVPNTPGGQYHCLQSMCG